MKNSSSHSFTLGLWLEHAATALDNTGVFLGHGTDNYGDEALHLTLPILGIPFDAGREVLGQVLTDEERQQLQGLLNKRIEQRIPTPYLTHQAWFALLPFYVDESVLIPRSPIAELIERQFVPWAIGKPQSILDLCCGGGCIGIACAEYLPEAQVDLADLSEQALAVAQKNIAQYGLQERVKTYQGDLFSALPLDKNGEDKTYDVIVCNPPYVDAQDMDDLPPEYLHEPRMALAAGEDGLDLVRVILSQAAKFLKKNGILIVEVGNSCEALEEAYPTVPFIWLEFERGGHGVFLLTKPQLEQIN